MIIPIREIRRLIDAYDAELIVPEGHELVLQVNERESIIRVHAVETDRLAGAFWRSDEAILGGDMIHRAEIPISHSQPFMKARVE